MTEPKKTARHRTRARSAGAASIELKPSNGDGEVKVQKAVAALEEISVTLPEPAAENGTPESDRSAAAAESEQEVPVEQLQQLDHGRHGIGGLRGGERAVRLHRHRQAGNGPSVWNLGAAEHRRQHHLGCRPVS